MAETTAVIILKWIGTQAGAYAVNKAFDQMAMAVGLRDGAPPDYQIIEEYLVPIREAIAAVQNTLDQNRLAKLGTGFDKLRDASSSRLRRELVASAVSDFQEIANLPPGGSTAGRQNKRWRCLALLGQAYAYHIIEDDAGLIARKLAEAVNADWVLSRKVLGFEFFERNPSLRADFSGFAVKKRLDIDSTDDEHSIRFASDGDVILLPAEESNYIDCFDSRELKRHDGSRSMKHGNSVETFCVSWDGSLAAAATIYGQDRYSLRPINCKVEAWHARTGRRVWAGDFDHRVRSLAFSRGNDLLAVGCYSKALHIVDLRARSVVRTVEAETVVSVAFGAGGLFAYATFAEVRVFELGDWKQLAALQREREAFGELLFSPDGKLLVIAEDGGTVRAWSMAEGRFVRSYGGLTWLAELRFSHDGRTLIGHSSGELTFWDTESGKIIKTIDLGSSTNSFDLSPDSKAIVVYATNPRGFIAEGGQVLLLK
jgi:hypothetical protein